jgi:HSP20 family molecular chaperone IbpA
MIPSPFHGIFSASAETDAGGTASHKTPAHGHAKQHGARPAAPAPHHGAQTGGQVALDIFEYENYYILKAPMAGVKLADLDIEITDNVITIRGQRKQTDDIPQNQYFLQECFWGEFSRSVTLPCSIDPKKVKATFNKDAILKILVPKEERVKIIRISE